MNEWGNRREFFGKGLLGGAALSLGNLGILGTLPSLSAEEVAPDPDIVRLRPEIEPTVRLIEETSREKLFEVIAPLIKSGKLRYQEVLAALLLAGVRNVEPRPSVGFKFHAVLVVNSAHLASVASPDNERWLPIFWALDQFKVSQWQDTQERNWTMSSVDEGKVPPAHRAKKAFIQAMEKWDVEAADVAAAAVARHCSEGEAFELFARYGSRDFRSIGHKAIFVANSFRTLQHIGWRHAEPVLRSLAYALLNHNGQDNPATSDHAADRPWRENEKLVGELSKKWRSGRIDQGVTSELLSLFRTGSASEVAEAAVEMMGKGTSAQSIQDAVFLGGAELLMRQPGIVALHVMTTTNAMRYTLGASSDETTRRRIFLQNLSFLPMFRDAIAGRGEVGTQQIDQITPSEGSIPKVLDTIGKDRNAAAGMLLKQLDEGAAPKEFTDAARRLVFVKGMNSHDYKFSSAVLEDFHHVSPGWRNRYLAASTFQLRGTGAADNELVKRARAALG